jgi:hypothetical protein
MRITLEPSMDADAHAYISVSADTRSNDEKTSDAVEIALKLLVAYGHSMSNVAEAAQEWAEEKRAEA